MLTATQRSGVKAQINNQQMLKPQLRRCVRQVFCQAMSTGNAASSKKVIFVMGGPGSGKGTQCERLERDYDLAFFSAGELLRGVIKSGSEEGKKLQAIIMEGKIVPSQVTVGLLQRAIAETSKQTVLIDGFPRNMENWEVWQDLVKRDCDLAIFFDCPEEVMMQRLLKRNTGRADDNEETIRKRVQGFQSQTMPVVELYQKKGMLHKFNTDRPVDDIQKEVRVLLDKLIPQPARA